MMAATVEPRKMTPDLSHFFEQRDHEDPKIRKEFEDFKDRAAYVYVTGTFPTHLRTFFTSLLRKATRYASDPSALDKRSGSLQITPEIAQKLDLEAHPMVQQTRAYLKHGFKIQTSRGLTERKPYSKIFMFRERNPGVEKVTIQIDGSVKAGW